MTYETVLDETPARRATSSRVAISGVLTQVATEVGDGEGDPATLGRVDEALLEQSVPRRGQRLRLAAQQLGDLGRRHRVGLDPQGRRERHLGHGAQLVALGGGRPLEAGAEEADRKLGLRLR